MASGRERESGLEAVRQEPRPTPPSLEALRRELEELGLSNYEARMVLALLRFGSASPAQLARSADVPRTSAYQVLEELQAKGLADRVPSGGPALWSSRGRDDVLARLEEAQELRLREHQDRAERVRAMLAQALPEAPTPALPYVQVIHDPARVKTSYEQMLAAAQSELLVFNRPPYSWSVGNPNPVVLEAARRVPTRVLYQAAQVNDPANELWRKEMDAYHAVGVQGRVVDSLPMKLAIADRKVALLSLDDPVLRHVGYPTSLVVDHPGFAEVQADAFEYLWQSARPYPG